MAGGICLCVLHDNTFYLPAGLGLTAEQIVRRDNSNAALIVLLKYSIICFIRNTNNNNKAKSIKKKRGT